MTRACRRFLARAVSPAVVLLLVVSVVASPPPSYRESVEKWRQDYEAKLRADDGWLTVAALLWMHEGENSFGSAPDNNIVLPYSYVPARAGRFDLHSGKTVVHINPGVPVTMRGKPVDTAELPPDSKQDRLVIGDLTFFVHASGSRYAIRVKDKNNQLRKEFKGLHWYPVDPAYRFTARYVAYPSPREIQIENLVGDRGTTLIAGYVAFSFGGTEYRLDVEKADDEGNLFIVFRDLTSKTDTYQAARFLDADPPKDGKVEIDFNKAYNPPCAYNPYATCPLPSPGNRLKVAIPAGEKRYH
jgi:uncharacterized protein (DUF1684 family)